MDWINNFVVPLLGVALSILGGLVALDQITAGPRLRRQSSFWRELRESAASRSDSAVYLSLEREANSKALALQALPAWRLSFPAFAIIAGTAAAWESGRMIGGIEPGRISWGRVREVSSESGLELPMLLIVPIITFFGIIGWLNILIERAQIKGDYLDGKPLSRENVSPYGDHWQAASELGTRGVIILFISTLGGLGLFATFGAWAGHNEQNFQLPNPTWSYLLMMISVFMFMVALFAIIPLSEALGSTWEHPRKRTKNVARADGRPRGRRPTADNQRIIRRAR